jgi:DNA-binding NtrC family response regulator
MRYARQKHSSHPVSTAVFANQVFIPTKIQELFSLIARLSKSSVNLFLAGPPGVGKKTIGEYMHVLSEKTGNCLVVDGLKFAQYTVNAFLEYCKIAANGTIIVQHVDGLSLELQQLLHRILSDRILSIVSEQFAFVFHTRFVLTSSVDLQCLVEHQGFSRELLSVLNVLRLEVPALKERKTDVLELLQCMLPECTFSKCAKSALGKYSWAHNMRELLDFVALLRKQHHKKHWSAADIHALRFSEVLIHDSASKRYDSSNFLIS